VIYFSELSILFRKIIIKRISEEKKTSIIEVFNLKTVNKKAKNECKANGGLFAKMSAGRNHFSSQLK